MVCQRGIQHASTRFTYIAERFLLEDLMIPRLRDGYVYALWGHVQERCYVHDRLAAVDDGVDFSSELSGFMTGLCVVNAVDKRDPKAG